MTRVPVSLCQCSEGGKDPTFGIELRGKTALEQVEISAFCRVKNSAGVLARGTAATPTLQNCSVVGCGGAGVLLASGARPVLAQCSVRECAGAGALVHAGCVLDVQGGAIGTCAEGVCRARSMHMHMAYAGASSPELPGASVQELVAAGSARTHPSPACAYA